MVAFDCCFHPEALLLGGRYKAFRDLLVSTALQGIEEACRLQNQATSVSKDFHILKGAPPAGLIDYLLISVSVSLPLYLFLSVLWVLLCSALCLLLCVFLW